MERGKVRGPYVVFFLMVLTCGVYAIYWGYTVAREINAALGREEINPKRELALTLLTFGLWANIFLWRLEKATLELERAWNVESTTDVLSLLYFAPSSIQAALNSVWWWGTPGGARYGGGHL